MSAAPAVDPHGFKRILYRNIALPLIVGVISVPGFVALIAYLLSAMGRVEHSDRVIAGAQSMAKLAVDQETGMRGFLITGEESYLEPYRRGMPRMQAELDALTRMVSDNLQQVDRLHLLARLHGLWAEFANQALALKRDGGDWLPTLERLPA
jgi:CHASE3 domain sensor protein